MLFTSSGNLAIFTAIPPWSVEDIGAAFVVRDAHGQGLVYVYYEEEPGRRSAAKMLTRDEARRCSDHYVLRPFGGSVERISAIARAIRSTYHLGQ